jgi:23S rRNA (cytidine1920-2'-O)/16S rRNA (cytidine1409-2'-O)-methyltransferase
MEGVNARHVDELPEPMRIVTIDAAFISLKILLPVLVKWLDQRAEVIALVKPQFEAGVESVGKGGIVKDPVVHTEVIEDVIRAAENQGLAPEGLMRSPIRGTKGNVEFLLWLRNGGSGAVDQDLISHVVSEV